MGKIREWFVILRRFHRIHIAMMNVDRAKWNDRWDFEGRKGPCRFLPCLGRVDRQVDESRGFYPDHRLIHSCWPVAKDGGIVQSRTTRSTSPEAECDA